MTYARARLWLGISGVGLMVIVTLAMLIAGIPRRLLPETEYWQASDLFAMCGFVAASIVVVLPFDFFGGYLLPKRFGRDTPEFGSFCRRWSIAVATQSLLFLVTGLAILTAGRLAGLAGTVSSICVIAMFYLAGQGALAAVFAKGIWSGTSNHLKNAIEEASQLEKGRSRLVVIDHRDQGFTGGVVGLPGREIILVPRKWFDALSAEELAAAVTRRVEAVSSGGRTRGVILALAWILTGFVVSALLPGAGVRSVAGLVTTCCGFTCWTFLGLLVLPTVSRRASYWIDERVVQRGISRSTLNTALAKLDRLQDDEPQRSALVEAIFHPVPSVENRQSLSPTGGLRAWHVARMTLFLSWACYLTTEIS